jgi:hypothetical protein
MPADLSSFTLVCPGYRAAAGRLAFTVGANLVAELDDADLIESWEAAQGLSVVEATELTDAAATHLMELLAHGIDAVDIAEAVTDAAVVFLLAMKRHGISDPKRIPACSVMWNGAGERVMFSA